MNKQLGGRSDTESGSNVNNILKKPLHSCKKGKFLSYYCKVNNEIISDFYTNPEFKRITRNACKDCGYHFTDDLHSEVVLRIMEVGDDLTEIQNKYYYFHAFAIRVITYDYSVKKKYGYNENRIDRPCSDIEDTIDDSEYSETKIDLFYNNIDRYIGDRTDDTWRDKYEKELFKLYLKHGSYREVQKVVNIPFRSIADTLKKFRDKLKKQL